MGHKRKEKTKKKRQAGKKIEGQKGQAEKPKSHRKEKKTRWGGPCATARDTMELSASDVRHANPQAERKTP